MTLTIKNIVSIIVLGTCAVFLVLRDVSIWLGGTQIDAIYLLAP